MSLLLIGSKGDDVVELQTALNAYLASERGNISEDERALARAGQPAVDRLYADGLALKVDGDFGAKTDAAVRLLQVNERILVDGKVGATTSARLHRRPVPPIVEEDPALNGLLVDGKIVHVPGVRVVNAHDAAWAHLSPGDCQPRRKKADGSMVGVTMWVWHKTIADYPERLLPGRGPAGGARATADYWRRTNTDGTQERYGGAHLISGDDGELACLADLRRVEAYHVGTIANAWSVGHETREKITAVGSTRLNDFWEAAANTTIESTYVGCPALGIQLQMHGGAYTGHPMRRMLDAQGRERGGGDAVGIFTHRDFTEQRGKWDPGEIMRDMMIKRGVEVFDFESREDIDVWKERQRALVRLGHQLEVTGVPTAATVEALKLEGYAQGIWALGRPGFHG